MTFVPIGSSAEAREGETIFDAARRAGVPLANSCGALGVCARCCVRVLSGADHLAPPTTIESSVSERRGLSPDERLACQAVVRGECEVTTGYW